MIMAQPFVIVYQGKLFGRPDMVAFARKHPSIQKLLAQDERAP